MFVSSGDLKIPESYSLKLVAQNISRMNSYVILWFRQSLSRQLISAAHGFNWAILGYLNSFLWGPLFVFFIWMFGFPCSTVAPDLDEHAFQRHESWKAHSMSIFYSVYMMQPQPDSRGENIQLFSMGTLWCQIVGGPNRIQPAT